MPLTLFPSPRRHPALDLAGAGAAFAEMRLPEPGGVVVSVGQVLAVEAARRAAGWTMDGVVATDVFVWGQGEPKDRTLTKIGGLPYWPAERPWPEAGGQPLPFVAQFNFADSRDLVGELPGEILVVFSDPGERWRTGDVSGLQFEWMRVGDGRVVVERLVPKPARPFFKGYGVIHRSQERAGAVPEVAAWRAATKIGGLPGSGREGAAGERFLGQFAPVRALPGLDYPWVNRPRALGETADAHGVLGETNLFGWGSEACLEMWLRADGGVTPRLG